MKSIPTSLLRISYVPILLAVILLGLNCSNPDYPSSQPGVIEVHLRSVSHNIPHSPLNSFTLQVTQIQAVRNDAARITIYEDVKAIDRKAAVFNTLSYDARDSAIIMGQTQVPPGIYTGINLLIDPGSTVIIDGYRTLKVVTDADFNNLLTFSGYFEIKENTTTVVTVTIDLDQSLVKGAYQCYFRPTYYISSVR